MIPELFTPRLRLRAFSPDDLDGWAAIVADPAVMRFIGSGGPVDRDVAWRQMAFHLGEWALRGRGSWAVERRADGALIGRAGFLQPESWPGEEVAWLFARPAWGHGFATEAVRAAVDHGRRWLGAGPLISLIRPDNTPSLRLAERVGAHFEKEIDFLGATARRYRHP